MAAADTTLESIALESVLIFYKVTTGGQRVYRNREAAIRDIYVPQATAEQLGNPGQIKLTIQAA